jgi:hypothetical protein
VVGGFTHDGVAALKSGVPPVGSESWVQTSMNGPGVLSFWWGFVSSHFSQVEFYIDAIKQASYGNSVYNTWQQKSYNISSGTHSLYWRFTQTQDYGDCAYLDQVVFTPSGIQGLRLDAPKVAGKSLVVGFDSSSNISYVLESVAVLPPTPPWKPITTNIGTGQKVSLTLTNALSNSPAGFYRLKTQ